MRLNMKRMALVLAATLLMLFGTLNAAFAWTLSGTIYGGSNPLPNATITLADDSTRSQVGTTTTDAGGAFLFTVSDGTYNLTISPPNGSAFSASAVNSVVVNGADVNQSVILIQQAVTLSGVVSGPGGTPASNIQLEIRDQTSDMVVGTLTTDGSGSYSFPLAPGTYRINAQGGSSWGYVSNIPTPQYFQIYSFVSNLAVTANTVKNFSLPFVTLSGMTTDSKGVGVGSVVVKQQGKSINDIPGAAGASAYVGNDTSPEIRSDASGNYSLTLLAGTGYAIALVPPTGLGLGQAVVSNVDVPVNTIRNFPLSASITLSGVATGPGGTPASNIQLEIRDQISDMVVGTLRTDGSGSYSIPLAAGTYKINVQGGPAWGYVSNIPTPQYFQIYSFASNLAVTANTVKNFSLPFVTLSGMTTDGSGVGIGGVVVKQQYKWINDIPGAAGAYGYLGNDSTPAITSDASGNYSLTLLAGSGYSIALIPPTGLGLGQAVVNNVDVPVNTLRNFPLSASIALSGVVTGPGGTPASNIQLEIRDQISDMAVGTLTTDGSGSYSFPLAAGTYKINVQGGPAWGYVSNIPTPQYYQIYSFVSNLAVTANTVRNFSLPFVTLSGKTTDSNGVGIGGVVVKQQFRWIYDIPGAAGSSAYLGNDSSPAITSDASGNYSLTLLAGTGYSEAIIPPPGSRFAQTVMNNLDASRSLSQNIILSMPDTTPPVILSGPTVSSNTDTTATIEWLTNEPAKGAVVYGKTNPPGTTAAEPALTFTPSHSQQLTGLSPNTTYYVKVTATDAASNGPTTSSVISFTTSPTPDTTPPVILTGPTVNTITHISAVVEWTTDEPSTGSVAYGLSSTPDQTVIDETLSTTHRVTLSGLTPETFYFLQVTATDAAKNIAAPKPAISFPTLAVSDNTPPVVVEGPMAINISDIGATIVWKTDEPATSGVSWDDGIAHGVLSDDTLTTNHSMTITGLTATVTYNFTVASKDAFNNGPTLSAGKSFTTNGAPDTKPPVFTQTPIVKNTTHQSAVLYWETDEPASATIRYGTSTVLSFGKTDAKAELNTKHNRPLTGLLPGTTYYFRVRVTDAAKNTGISGIYSFTTDVNPDTKAPVITADASIIYSTDTAATVSFTTDKPCDTVVNYGPNGSISNQKSNSEKVNDHQVTLTNLTPNTSYNVQVSCTDMSGNTVVASAGRPSTLMALNYAFILSDAFVGAPGTGFITPSQPDTTPPVLTATPTATAITSSMVRIVWSSDEIADSQVFFGLAGQNLTNFAGDIVQVTGHSVALTNLSANTSYQFKVQSTDPSNNTITSAVYTFTTAALADTTPPVISAISASGVTSSQIHVSWTTNEPSTTVLKYGTSPFSLTAQVSIAGLGTGHSVTLYNLLPGTTYYLAPVSADGSDNTTQGGTQSVTLSGQAPTSYTVTATAGTGGSVTPASQTVYSGYQLALAVTPDSGFLINSITGCGGTLVGSVYTTATVTNDCSVSASFNIDPNAIVTALTSTAYPAGGNYSGGTLMVQLKPNSQTAAIYYTTDGSTPSTSSPGYSAPIAVIGTKTIKSFAKDGATTETAKSATYTATAAGQPGASFSGLKAGTSFTVYRSEGGKAPSSIYSGSQTSFTDADSLKPNTIYAYTVASELEDATELLTIRTPLYNGWNIIAVPYNTAGIAASTFFASPVSTIYQWIPTGATVENSTTQLGSYATIATLTPGLGYFAKASNSSTLLAYSGATGPASATVALKPGWTMIANPNTAIKTNIGTNWLIDGNPLSNAITTDKIGGGIYWWNGATYDSWSIVGVNPQIEPWKGYWLLNLDSVSHVLTIQ